MYLPGISSIAGKPLSSMKTLGDFPRPGRLIATVFQGAKPPATDRTKCAGKMATTSMAQTSAAACECGKCRKRWSAMTGWWLWSLNKWKIHKMWNPIYMYMGFRMVIACDIAIYLQSAMHFDTWKSSGTLGGNAKQEPKNSKFKWS